MRTLLLFLSCASLLATDVTFNLANFTTEPASNRSFTITPQAVSVFGTNTILTDVIECRTPKTSGSLTVTNLAAGQAKIDVLGKYKTTFYILIPSNGTVNAQDIIVGSTNIAANTVAWSAAASDARYVLASSYTNGITTGTIDNSTTVATNVAAWTNFASGVFYRIDTDVVELSDTGIMGYLSETRFVRYRDDYIHDHMLVSHSSTNGETTCTPNATITVSTDEYKISVTGVGGTGPGDSKIARRFYATIRATELPQSFDEPADPN